MTQPARAPRIGVTCDFETRIDSRGMSSERFWLHAGYVRALGRAGAQAYLLPYGPGITDAAARAQLAPLHGLVVSGGHFDIPPERFGQSPHPLCGPLARPRTDYEAALLLAAWGAGMPTLGICGGMQLMAVLAGGSLYQDLRLRPGTAVHEQPHDRAQPGHGLRVSEGSRLAGALGATTTAVNSTHHQLVDDPGSLEPVAWAPDGVIEAVEGGPGPFVLGVQWHPEAMADPQQQGIYGALVAAAAAAMP